MVVLDFGRVVEVADEEEKKWGCFRLPIPQILVRGVPTVNVCL